MHTSARQRARPRSRTFWSMLALVLLAVVPYLPSLRGPFLWDDHIILFLNRAPRNLSNVPRLFIPSEWEKLHRSLPSPYRPLRESVFSLIGAASGCDPLAFRCVNLGLNAVNVLLLFAVVRLVIGSRASAWWAAAVFAAHPVHVETVAWIKNLGEILALGLSLGALWCHFEGVRRGGPRRWLDRWSLGAAGLFLLGAMSKESAFFVPVALLVAAWWRVGTRDRRAAALRVTPMLAVIALYAVLQGYVMLSVRLKYSAPDKPPARVPHALLVAESVVEYFRLTLLPVRLHPWHAFPTPQGLNASALAAVGVCAGILAFLAFLWRRRPEAGWWLLISLVSLAPAANVLINYHRPMAEQRAYAPSLGVAALVGCALGAAARRRRAVATALGATLLACLAIMTARQSTVWRSSYALWRTGARWSPSLPRVRANLAIAYFHTLELDRLAECEILRALALDPADKTIWQDLAAIWVSQQRLDEAEKYMVAALQERPEDPRLLFAYARLQEKKGHKAEALRFYDTAIRLKPDHADALYNRGVLFERMQRFDEAAADYRAVLEIEPRYAKAASNLGFLLLGTARTQEALRLFRQALDAQPGLAQARAGLAQALVRRGRPREAAAVLEELLQERPDWLDLWEVLAEAYTKAGDSERAQQALRRGDDQRRRDLDKRLRRVHAPPETSP